MRRAQRKIWRTKGFLHAAVQKQGGQSMRQRPGSDCTDTQEQKPVFDLLMRDDLSKEEIRQIKSVSVEILKAIQRRMEEVQDLFEKQSTRDGLRQEIYDLLYDDRTGLPASKYDDDALSQKTDAILLYFMHRADLSLAAGFHLSH